jgi:hypothetical protein
MLPDNISELPEGFGPQHPTVKFFLGKGWLVPVDKDAKAPDPIPGLTPEKVTPENTTTELTQEEAAAKAAEEAAAIKKAETEARIKALDRMNLEALRNEAAAVGVEWADGDTKAMIAQKITEKLQAELR